MKNSTEVAFMTLINSNSQLKSYDEIANKNGLTANNTAVLKHIKLIATKPTEWLDNPLSLNRFAHSKKILPKLLLTFPAQMLKTKN